VSAIVALILLALVLVVVVLLRRKGSGNDDWEIEYDELEVGEQLGAGGYGEVHKATWKGTEVAVKTPWRRTGSPRRWRRASRTRCVPFPICRARARMASDSVVMVSEVRFV
jgi:hypothetical protein